MGSIWDRTPGLRSMTVSLDSVWPSPAVRGG